MKSKTVKLIVLAASALLVVGCLAGCGKNATVEVTGNATDEEISQMISELAEDGDLDDLSVSTNGAISVTYTGTCTDDYYSFTYNAKEFTATPGDDHDGSVSYTKKDVQTAGSNVMNVSVVDGTDAKAALNDVMEGYGMKDAEIDECNFGADGVKAYFCTTGNQKADGSDLTTCETVYAIPSGDHVVLVDVMRTIGTDENTEMDIDDAFSAILDTFTVENAQ